MAAGPASSTTPAPVAHRKLLVLCTIIATLMQTLDSTIANVALPYMQGTFSSTLDQVTWIITSYIVASAVMTAPVGWLASRYGRKRFFILCLAGFTIASMLCGLAVSLDQMVIYRIVQGAAGAAIVPLSQAIMMDLYPPQQRGSAMAMWGMGVMVGPIVGPTLGGYLTDAYDWRYVFFINLPVGMAAIAGLWLFLKETRDERAPDFDWTGFIVLAIGIGCLQLLLDRGHQADWFASTEIIAYALIGGLGFYLFLVHVAFEKHPLMPLSMFTDINFVTGLITMFSVGMVLVASVALMAPFLQGLGGYSVWETGLVMAPRGFGVMLAMMFAGRLVNRIDARFMIGFGLAVLALSSYEMSLWTPDVATSRLVITTILQGFGLGFIFVPLQVIAFATLAPAFRTDGAALFSLVRNFGSAIGVSIVSTMLATGAQTAHARIAESVTPFNRMAQDQGAYLLWNFASPRGLAALNAEISRQALAIAYSQDFLLMCLITLPTLLLVFLMRKPRRAAGPAPMVHAD